jgi:hypothetical protein
VNLKSKIVIFSIQSYCGSKLVKLVGEQESYDIGCLLTEGRKGLTPLMSIQKCQVLHHDRKTWSKHVQ